MTSLKPLRKMKLYPHGKLTDTEVRMKEKQNALQTKWDKYLAEEKTIPKKGCSHERKIRKINGHFEVHEQCIMCSEWKALYDFDLRSNYMERESSKEQINNPCRECNKSIRLKKMDNKPEQYVTRLLYNYPKLTQLWYDEQIKKQGGLFSAISGLPITPLSTGCWQLSIQNNMRDLEHLPENCELIALEENIAQHDAIPDIKKAYIELYTEMIEHLLSPDSVEEEQIFMKKWEDRFKLTPKQSGVESKSRINSGCITSMYDKETQQKHLKSMFTRDTKAAFQHDKKSKRIINPEEKRLKAADMFTIGKKQNWKCALSGIKLSMNRNSWNYLSLERIDNKKNHTYDNTILICRLLNTSDNAQWTIDKLQFALKHQKLVEIPESIKSIL